MLTSQQCRMARAALNLGIRDLAKIADVSPNTIARLERGENLHKRTQDYLRGALELQGLTFVERHAVSAWGGDGVRLGDDQQKSQMARVIDAMWNLPDDAEANLYDAILDFYDQYFDVLDAEGREPDVWERDGLNFALGFMNRSDPVHARGLLSVAITPPDNQSPTHPFSAERVAATDGLDVVYFRRSVEQLRARGMVERPIQEKRS
jgi:transcriptional regulator with XRE-family HTH domain